MSRRRGDLLGRAAFFAWAWGFAGVLAGAMALAGRVIHGEPWWLVLLSFVDGVLVGSAAVVLAVLALLRGRL